MMDKTLDRVTGTREEALELLESRGPLLVEVRFPRMGTSSDWFLLDSEEEFDALWQRLARGVELHLTSVWDVEARRGKVAVAR